MKYFRMRYLIGAASALSLLILSLPAIGAMMAPPSVSIVSPAAGSTVTSVNIPVRLTVNNFRIECGNMGKTSAPPGEGHVHAMVDGMGMTHLTNVECSDHFSISGEGLKSGKHTLTVVLANDAHVMNSMPAMVSFNYKPNASSLLPRAMRGGMPSVAIVSPKNGATVGRTFNLVLAVKHFDLSCNLEGKADVAGYGHLHIYVHQSGETTASAMTPMVTMMKTPRGMAMGKQLMMETHMSKSQLDPMMTMAEPALVGMPCTTTVPLNLSKWHSGKTQIVVLLANNDHMPTMGTKPATVTVNVK